MDGPGSFAHELLRLPGVNPNLEPATIATISSALYRSLTEDQAMVAMATAPEVGLYP